MAFKVKQTHQSILVLSDFHLPYGHKDALKYTTALKKKYKPDLIICLGDELDYHSLSYHDSDPNLESPSTEFEKAKAQLSAYYKLFPEMLLCTSNHGSMVFRKAKTHGIPSEMIKPYNELLESPPGWHWHDKIIANEICFVHQYGSNVYQSSMKIGMSLVQSHYHTTSEIKYYMTEYGLNFGCTVGCMIDDKSLAFAYNKAHAKRPVLAHLIIQNNVPKLLPMQLTKSGRWNGLVT